jgi:FRG domain-containing protein
MTTEYWGLKLVFPQPARMDLMKTAVAIYRQLTEELAKLPKPAPGLVRVYRGQTKDFGVMIPTGLRPGAVARDLIWQYCAMAIARELSPRTGTAPNEDSVWIEAIAQHYGPGSPLLDVTRSIDIALWFALHERRPVSAEHLVGPPGQPDKARDIPLKETWWEYRPSTTDGYLYVFDVPEWNGSNVPSHGSLLDLSSRRILSKAHEYRLNRHALLQRTLQRKEAISGISTFVNRSRSAGL